MNSSEPFFKVPHKFYREDFPKKIGPIFSYLYISLLRQRNIYDRIGANQFFCTDVDLADQSGISIATVSRGRKVLKKNKLIEYTKYRYRGKATTYTILPIPTKAGTKKAYLPDSLFNSKESRSDSGISLSTGRDKPLPKTCQLRKEIKKEDKEIRERDIFYIPDQKAFDLTWSIRSCRLGLIDQVKRGIVKIGPDVKFPQEFENVLLGLGDSINPT